MRVRGVNATCPSQLVHYYGPKCSNYPLHPSHPSQGLLRRVNRPLRPRCRALPEHEIEWFAQRGCEGL
jgi:hypothetical protein